MVFDRCEPGLRVGPCDVVRLPTSQKEAIHSLFSFHCLAIVCGVETSLSEASLEMENPKHEPVSGASAIPPTGVLGWIWGPWSWGEVALQTSALWENVPTPFLH